MGLLQRGGSYGKSYGDEYFATVGNTALTLTIPAGSLGALVSVIGAEPIKWRVSGVDPTASIGHPLAVGGHAEVYRDDMKNFKMVSGNGAVTTSVFVTYFGE